MSSQANFDTVAKRLMDKTMGTENVGPLLYSLIKMYRPYRSLAIGLGHSTLHLLRGLAENVEEFDYDRAVLSGTIEDPDRLDVLNRQYFEEQSGGPGGSLLHGIDDFSEFGSHLESLEECIDALGYSDLFRLHKTRYQDFDCRRLEGQVDFIWVDCGHQLDYPEIINRFWPSLSRDGSLMAIHYTYVDLEFEHEGRKEKLMIAGAVANAIKKQQLDAGIASSFEFISLVEPHKHRQGSVSLIRRVDPEDRCRNSELSNEFQSLYGCQGPGLGDLNEE